ncbi:MAG: carboxypeptidase-like regulatory domain-containing protein, partial [Bacteroidales bacterium]|nr:carboxypeptidase-like regulatory domain-containing protein [Bacteroidales bacterium]
MRRFVLILCMLLASASLLAQTTKVRGTVTDADTGEPIPFAGIFFKDTTIGLTADIDGKYTLETRDPAARILVCQLLGYDTQEKEVKR